MLPSAKSNLRPAFTTFLVAKNSLTLLSLMYIYAPGLYSYALILLIASSQVRSLVISASSLFNLGLKVTLLSSWTSLA